MFITSLIQGGVLKSVLVLVVVLLLLGPLSSNALDASAVVSPQKLTFAQAMEFCNHSSTTVFNSGDATLLMRSFPDFLRAFDSMWALCDAAEHNRCCEKRPCYVDDSGVHLSDAGFHTAVCSLLTEKIASLRSDELSTQAPVSKPSAEPKRVSLESLSPPGRLFLQALVFCINIYFMNQAYSSSKPRR